MKIRCRARHPDRARFKFKCRWCKRWVCGHCEGTHDTADPIGNELCDSCWLKREGTSAMKEALLVSRKKITVQSFEGDNDGLGPCVTLTSDVDETDHTKAAGFITLTADDAKWLAPILTKWAEDHAPRKSRRK